MTLQNCTCPLNIAIKRIRSATFRESSSSLTCRSIKLIHITFSRWMLIGTLLMTATELVSAKKIWKLNIKTRTSSVTKPCTNSPSQRTFVPNIRAFLTILQLFLRIIWINMKVWLLRSWCGGKIATATVSASQESATALRQQQDKANVEPQIEMHTWWRRSNTTCFAA